MFVAVVVLVEQDLSWHSSEKLFGDLSSIWDRMGPSQVSLPIQV